MHCHICCIIDGFPYDVLVYGSSQESTRNSVMQRLFASKVRMAEVLLQLTTNSLNSITAKEFCETDH